MLCPNCDKETLEGALYCTQCGTPRLHSCPLCQSGNPQGSAYCYACGAYLLAQSQPQPETPFRPAEAYWIEEAYRGETPFHFGESVRPGATENVERGGFWIRFVGELIDYAILLIPGLLLFLIVPFGGDFILYAAYTIGFWVLWGATPGKRLMGLRIERPDGSRIGPGRCVARYFASMLSFLLLFAGYIMIGLREDKRGLHDLICDTVVVKQEPASPSQIANEFWSSVRGVAR